MMDIHDARFCLAVNGGCRADAAWIRRRECFAFGGCSGPKQGASERTYSSYPEPAGATPSLAASGRKFLPPVHHVRG